jgi:aldehyde dehydrogenase (NAD(P)+)
MAAWKLGPCLACGNTTVLKPAEQTPLSALYLATLIKKAEFPPGVVNILNGHGRITGAAIASHLDIDKVAFTGSTQTGREIMKLASINLKNISLETGGKSPLIVFDDADLESAIRWAHSGIMFNQGQVCTANSRVLVQEGVYEKFVAAFKEQVKNVSKIGNPFEDSTFQGPQVTKVQFDRVMGYIESGKSEGATLSMGGEAYKDVNGKGFFISPTIFANVQDHHKIYRGGLWPVCGYFVIQD